LTSSPTPSSSKAWIKAARLRTLPLAFSSIITGMALSAERGSAPWDLFILAIITTLLLQVLSNLANDYGDFQNGADNVARIGPSRAVQQGWISPKAMRSAIILITILAILSGIYLLYRAFSGAISLHFLLFLLLGIFAIAAAIKYTTGKNPYGYQGLGDVSVLFFFGVLGVTGSYFLFNSSFDYIALLPALSIGCFSTAVLNLNNMRDIENDEVSHKITLAVRLGNKKAKVYHFSLILFAWLSITSYLFIQSDEILDWLCLLAMPPFLIHLLKVKKAKSAAQFDPELKKVALSTFLFSLLFLFSQIL